MWSNCCCQKGACGCHLKRVTVTKEKYGFPPLNIGTPGAIPGDRRRWLQSASVISSGGKTYTVAQVFNPITGESTTTVTGSVFPEPFTPPTTSSSSATVQNNFWDFVSNTVTETITLSNEYTDEAVYADAKNIFQLLTPAPVKWDAIGLDHSVSLGYDSNGDTVVLNDQPLAQQPCAIPVDVTIAPFTEQMAGASAAPANFPGGQSTALTLTWSRFYFTGTACVLTRYVATQPGMPAIADTCTLVAASLQGDSPAVGPSADIGPINILDAADDDPGYYEVDLEVMNPWNASPNPITTQSNPWGCTCQENLAP